jgi:hypothetical protein
MREAVGMPERLCERHGPSAMVRRSLRQARERESHALNPVST